MQIKNNQVSIQYSKGVEDYLTELVDILFEQEYFSFSDTAKRYVFYMKTYFELNIGSLSKYPAPPYFSKYQKGMQYVRYPSNKRTTWYFFFLQEGNKYLVCYITNNHFEGQYIR